MQCAFGTKNPETTVAHVHMSTTPQCHVQYVNTVCVYVCVTCSNQSPYVPVWRGPPRSSRISPFDWQWQRSWLAEGAQSWCLAPAGQRGGREMWGPSDQTWLDNLGMSYIHTIIRLSSNSTGCIEQLLIHIMYIWNMLV